MQKTKIQIFTEDDYKITVCEYIVHDAKANVIVASATGVPQRFYRHFANYLNNNGFNVFTLDYRGIGDSAPDSLKNFEVDYLDWAKQDLAALVEHTEQYNLPSFLVGHSYGGHALGLLPNIEEIKAAYVCGVGAGWSGWMPTLERIKVNIMWHFLAPILVRLYGFMAWSKLNMGEDLPLGVYKQWKHWCKYPHYFFDDPTMPEVAGLFARFKNRLVAVNALDDKWAQPSSRDAFFKGYSSAKLQVKDITPENYGLKSIDHMGYFSKNATLIWDDMLTLFNTELS